MFGGIESNFVLAMSEEKQSSNLSSTPALTKTNINDPSVFAKVQLREQNNEMFEEIIRISRSFLKGTGVSEVIFTFKPNHTLSHN
jgi:hypothetical protein